MKGTYVLLIENRKNSRIKVGSLGKIFFSPGFYVYVGSAMGGLEARIDRHLRKNKKTHWHIDYFLKSRNVKVRRVYYKVSGKKEECAIAKRLMKYGSPVRGFGCSDCKCESHLFWLRDLRFLDMLNSSRLWFRKTDF